MARHDVRIIDSGGHDVVPSRNYLTASGSTAILSGEPTVLTTIGTSRYVALLTDALPVIGTDFFAGIAAKDGSHTSSADGSVDVYLPLAGVVYQAKAKSAAAADTDAEINALRHKRVPFDLTSSSFTVDTAAADATTNGLIIVGGDSSSSLISFIVSIRATILGF